MTGEKRLELCMEPVAQSWIYLCHSVILYILVKCGKMIHTVRVLSGVGFNI